MSIKNNINISNCMSTGRKANIPKLKNTGRNSTTSIPATCPSSQRELKPVIFYPDPSEDCLILSATNLKEARQLLKSEAEKLLEEGWEVMQVSKRSYIATLDACEIYLHVCSKGLSARIFQFDELFDCM